MKPMAKDKCNKPAEADEVVVTNAETEEVMNSAGEASEPICEAVTDDEPSAKTEAELLTEIEATAKKLVTLEDQHLRLVAEFANFRVRTNREKEGVYAMALTDVLTAWLPVIDNLERAIMAIEKESVATAEPISKGVSLVMQQIVEVLDKLKVEEIEALGQTFDPMRHEAVFHVEDESLPESYVAEVLQKGYRIGDKVIRHSVVKVAN